MKKVRCALVGHGYWGPNLARNAMTSQAVELAAICDSRKSELERLNDQYQRIKLTQKYSDVLADPMIDAVLIATPVSTHFRLAFEALQAGKHVLVEKPLATTVEHAQILIEEAQRRNRTLMVDHVFVYTPAVRMIRKLIDDQALGDLYYYDSVRVNLGLFQQDVNVIWDLAVHDLSIMDFVIDEKPHTVSAVSAAHVDGRMENIAYLSCFFPSGLIAHFHVNWLAPVKVRHTLLGGSRKMLIYNDLEPDEKIKIYDRGVDQGSNPMLQFGYRLGDMWSPMLGRTEALSTSINHFAECIRSGAAPLTDGRCGLRVVQLLDAASRSAVMKGQPMTVDIR